ADVYDAVTSRRSVRGFTDGPVPAEVVDLIALPSRRVESG
ncbi:MAG: hypothetical protein K0R68_1767, partial [Mycobacterium sp.]|nr:hypothetical protein [Mycobacterium sp.]